MFKGKNLKITKRAHTESAIKSKLIDLLTQLKGFKFATALVLVFKRIDREDTINAILFIHTQKDEKLSMKVTLMMCLNQSKLQLYQTYKNI